MAVKTLKQTEGFVAFCCVCVCVCVCVLVKMNNNAVTPHSLNRAAFMEESKTMMKLDHPHVLRILGTVVDTEPNMLITEVQTIYKFERKSVCLCVCVCVCVCVCYWEKKRKKSKKIEKIEKKKEKRVCMYAHD